MNNSLISVIVPVYNVAPWLDRCLQSIVNQTYKTLEIILVDDGSTDASALMCDQWALKDGRIRVIHKRNGGVSDAKNAGIEAAMGDYFSFVDPDDWPDLTMIDTLYAAVTDHQADMAICGFLFVHDDHSKHWQRCSEKTFVLNNQQLMQALLERRKFISYSYSWNKLYARRLWDTVRFPVGKRFEDTWVRSKLYAQCQKVVVVDKELYFYRQREDSILHSGNHAQLVLESLEASKQDCDFLKTQYPHLQTQINAVFLTELMNAFINQPRDKEPLPAKAKKELVEVFRRQKKGIWKHLPLKSRIKYLAFSISPKLMPYIGELYTWVERVSE